MLQLGRVCVPLGLACDLDCKYCYRHAGTTRVPDFNDLMIRYLGQLEPENCRAVVASGGEPLLYLDRVKQLFSYVPKNVHKKIMTNGIHLTQELIDWMNEEKIELHFSHDGQNTKYYRGVDVLDDPKICDLISQVNILRVHSVICKGNEDIIKNYEYIQSKIHKDDLYYTISPFFALQEPHELIDGFDYDLYMASYMRYQVMLRRTMVHYVPGKSHGLNVLPNGEVCAMVNMHKYGTVEDSLETILENKRKQGDYSTCENFKGCRIRSECRFASQGASPHLCKCLHIHHAVTDYLKEGTYG